jgi:hypothetical protein
MTICFNRISRKIGDPRGDGFAGWGYAAGQMLAMIERAGRNGEAGFNGLIDGRYQ